MSPFFALTFLALAEPVDLHSALQAREARQLRGAFAETSRIYREAADAEGEGREKLYRKAARRYAALAYLTRGRSNGYILYNLGNARFRLGEYGRAIAAYRRAEVLLPRHAATHRNLRFARANAPGGGPGPKPHPAAAAFFFWHYAMSLAEAEWLAAFLFLATLAALSARLFVSPRLKTGRTGSPWRRRLRTAAIALGVLAGVFVLSSIAKLRSRSRPWAVVTAEVVRVKSERAGRAIELFPLREGAEVRVLRPFPPEGGGWTRIEAGSSGLGDRRGWVETRAVEILSEPPPPG